ncbi:DUF2279 domain-containing protein [Bacteroidota bacterium]
MNIKSLPISLLFFISFTSNLYSQPTFIENYPDSLNKKRLNSVISTELVTYAVGLSFLSFVWYEDMDRVPFHYYNDWKGYFQMDKIGHAYSAYHESYNAYYTLRWAGMGKRKALIYGGTLGMFFQAPIEVFDGLYEGWGFSWYDIVANNLGSIFFIAQETFFNDQYVLMKFSYSPSGYPKYHPILGENQFESFFFDYNGHSYWLSANLHSITGIKKIPKWLNFAFGYSGNGMIKEFENPEYYHGKPFPYLDRYRQYVFSLDIDLSKIPVKRTWLKKTFRYMNLIKIPFPALEINSVNKFKFYPIYF